MAALVRMKEKFQLTVPVALRKRAKTGVGDLYEADVDDEGTITFRAKRLVDRGIAQARADYAAGRYDGPFDTVDELMASLNANKVKSTKRRR